MKRQPQLMDISRMRDILTPHLSQIREHVFLNSELGMIRGDHTVFSLLMRQKPPFIINDHRFGIILGGEAEINFNLQDRHLKSGTLVYIGPGTITVAHKPNEYVELKQLEMTCAIDEAVIRALLK